MRKADDRIFTFTINQNVYKILNFVLSQLIMNVSKILRTGPLTGAFLLLNTSISECSNYHMRKVLARMFTFTANQNVRQILSTDPLTGAFLLLNTGMSVKPNYHMMKVHVCILYIHNKCSYFVHFW